MGEIGGPMSRNIEWWLHHVTLDEDYKQKDSLLRRLWFALRGSKVSLSVASVALAVTLLNAVTATSFNRADVSIRYFIGVTTTLFAQLLFLRRQPQMRQWLGLIIKEARRQEKDDTIDPVSRKRMTRTAHRGPVMRWFFVVHAVCTEITFVYTLGSVPPSWADPESDPDGEVHPWATYMRWTALSLQGYGLLAGLAAIYTFLPLVLQVSLCSADLLETLGQQLKAAPCSVTHAAAQSTLLQSCLLADDAVSDLMAPVVIASLLMPLISLAQALSGVLDNMDALGTAPLFLTITVPLYLVGDRMAAARRSVMSKAAMGPWLDESITQRRLRIAVMLGASGIGAVPRCHGIGKLNRRGLLSVLKSWFSFLQAMVNLRK